MPVGCLTSFLGSTRIYTSDITGELECTNYAVQIRSFSPPPNKTRLQFVSSAVVIIITCHSSSAVKYISVI